HALFPVEVSDGARAGAGILVPAVHRNETRLVPQRTYVDGPLVLTARDDGQLNFFSVKLKDCVIGHCWPDHNRLLSSAKRAPAPFILALVVAQPRLLCG